MTDQANIEMYRATYITNYRDGTEDNHSIDGLVNLGSLEDIFADTLTDPLVTSCVFTIVKVIAPHSLHRTTAPSA